MTIFLQAVGRKPGFPSSDLLIFNNPLMQTNAVPGVSMLTRPREADGKDDLSIRGGSDRRTGHGVVNRRGRAS